MRSNVISDGPAISMQFTICDLDSNEDISVVVNTSFLISLEMTRFYDFLCRYYDLSFSRHNNLSNWIEPFLYFQKKDL